MVSYFIHNCILPILKHNDPSKNTRDMSIAFFLVFLSYSSVGVLCFLAYNNSSEVIAQDFLSMYSQTNIPAVVARFALLVQLGTVFPIILYIIRVQFFGLVFQNVWPSIFHVIGLNLGLIILGTLFAMFYPNIGTVLRFLKSNRPQSVRYISMVIVMTCKLICTFI